MYIWEIYNYLKIIEGWFFTFLLYLKYFKIEITIANFRKTVFTPTVRQAEFIEFEFKNYILFWIIINSGEANDMPKNILI